MFTKCDLEHMEESCTYIVKLGKRNKNKTRYFFHFFHSPTVFPNPITSMGTQFHFKVAKPPAATSNPAQLLNQKIKRLTVLLFKYAAKNETHFSCLQAAFLLRTFLSEHFLYF